MNAEQEAAVLTLARWVVDQHTSLHQTLFMAAERNESDAASLGQEHPQLQAVLRESAGRWRALARGLLDVVEGIRFDLYEFEPLQTDGDSTVAPPVSPANTGVLEGAAHLTDAQALDALAALVGTTEWSADTFEPVTALITATGRTVPEFGG